MKRIIWLGIILTALFSLSSLTVEKQVTKVAEYVPIGTSVVTYTV